MNALSPVVLMFTLLSCARHASPHDRGLPNPPIEAVLELASDDWTTFTPETIIQVCSEALADANRLSPKLLQAIYHRRGDAYRVLQKYADSKRDYDQILRVAPDEVRVKWKRAAVLAHLGSEREAVDELKALIKQHPDFAPAYASLANGFLLAGKVDDAIEYATRAIKIDSGSYQGYYARSRAYFVKNDFERCLEDINRCLEQVPVCLVSPEEDYFIRGFVLVRLERHKLGLDSLYAAQLLNPNSYNVKLELWNAYADLGNYQLAAHLSERLMKQDSRRTSSLLAYAESMAVVGKPTEALRAAEAAVAAEPENPWCHWALGNVHLYNSQYDAALQQWDRVLRMSPDHKGALASKTILLATCPVAKHRHGQQAVALGERLCRLVDHKESRALMALALARAETGDSEQANILARRAIAIIDPDSTRSKEYTAIAETLRQGKPWRFSTAIKAFAR